MNHPHKIRFDVNAPKAVEAVLYLLSKRGNGGENIYNVLKSLFEADKCHLNTHGRPVTGDVYIRMEHGTVPSLIKNLIDNNFITMAALNLDEVPFEKGGAHILIPRRSPNLDLLSETDIEALDKGAEKYLGLSFSEVRSLNHDEKCYRETGENLPIDFELMIENDEVKEMLAEVYPFKIVI